MTGEGDDDFAFDIGTGAAPPARSLRQSQKKDRRSLPSWVIVAVALLVGWVLGSFMSTSTESVSEPTEAQPVAELEPTAQAVEEQILFPPPYPPSHLDDAEPAADVLTVVMVQAPLRGVAIPADIRVIDNGVQTQIELDRLIAGATQGVVGQGDQRMLVVEESVVFMALDSVMVFDPFEKSEPVEVTQAIYLLPGSEPGRAWAVSSGSNSVIDIDVRRRQANAEYDLRAIGAPLASYNAGLVVAPANRSLGSFALWSPGRGIEKLWSMHEQTTFIGAAGNVLVVHTPQGLASYNAVTGSLTQTDYQIPVAAQHRSIVSPDGSRLAIAAQGSVTELPTVLIVDTATGEQLDSFAAAFAWQLQWTTRDDVLFMLPDTDAVKVMLRNTTTQTDRLVTELIGPNYWVTVAG